jgi:tetratricopeptide (TPR) repeat protein
MLFPVLGLLDMYNLALSRVSDHFVYLPLTALVALGAAAISRLHRLNGLHGLHGVLWLVVGVWVAGLAVLGMARARVFVSEEVLWRDTLAKNREAWCAHANLGWIVAEQKEYDDAEKHLEASLALKEDNAQAHSNLGRVLSLRGRGAEAEPHFRRALELKPKDFDIRRSYASALAEQGRAAEAVEQLREALRLRADMDVRLQLATLLYQTRRLKEAVAEYRAVVAAKPDELEALSNLAWLLATSADESLRNGAEAVRLAERACRVSDYKQARALGALGAAYAEAGRFAEAVEATQRAIEAARAGGDGRLAAAGEQLLRLFREGKAYHEAPAPAGR